MRAPRFRRAIDLDGRPGGSELGSSTAGTDVSRPTHPATRYRAELKGNGWNSVSARRVTTTGSYAFVQGSTHLVVVDLSHPDPSVLGALRAPPYHGLFDAAAATGSHVFAATSEGGLLKARLHPTGTVEPSPTPPGPLPHAVYVPSALASGRLGLGLPSGEGNETSPQAGVRRRPHSRSSNTTNINAVITATAIAVSLCAVNTPSSIG